MGLRDLKIHRTDVPYREQFISVRGISGSDLMLAVQDYGPQIALIFGKVSEGKGFDGDIKQAMLHFASEVPQLVGAVIALATDDYSPEAVEVGQKLPVNTQLECLEAIFNETFYSEAEVKKMIESLTRIVAGVSGALTTPDMEELISRIGTGASEDGSVLQ